ncbi:beta-galactosidase-1-like protein 2 [Aplysia californica]|uniref:Beta-galactosidase n=1 Tax=Aplysia californica TaxID=6500 RepID=A0ABM0ZY90_APLCA|nr:beta-galactosidase-1-like protein 2 [Aplysia californica]
MMRMMMRMKTVYILVLLALISVVVWIWWVSSFQDADLSRAGITYDVNAPKFADLHRGYKKMEKKAGTGEHIFIQQMKMEKAVPLRVNDSFFKDVDMASIADIPVLTATQIVNNNSYNEDIEDLQQETLGLTFSNREFHLNGKPFRVLSGAVHYFRTVPEYWEDRLKKLKACGLNTVETYVAWNLHEPSPGIFYFEKMLDVRKFVKLAGELGLYVILRPGPYICSELDFGGLPGWLLRDPNMKVRTNYPGYVAAVNRYFSVLLPMMKDLQFSEGGPIIMVQVENEYGVYGLDIQHLKLITYLLKREGIKELLVTSDNTASHLDFHQYALPTANFHRPGDHFRKISELSTDFPLMVMEFWSGWFDSWGQGHHSMRSVADLNESLTTLLALKASVNFYMFHGGTNFGFTAGAINLTKYAPFVTSYDYDALLTEAGDITPKYMAVRETLFQFYKQMGVKSLPKIPQNLPKEHYGLVKLTEMMPWDVLINLLPVAAWDDKVQHMEVYRDTRGQHSTLGYVLYSHDMSKEVAWNQMPGVQLSGFVKDRLLAILNSELIYTLHGSNSDNEPLLDYDWDQVWQSVVEKLRSTKKIKGSQRLDLVVENQGRVSYSPQRLDLLNQQRKGLSGPVYRYIFGLLEEWQIRFMNFEEEQYEMITMSSAWMNAEEVRNHPETRQAPALFRGHLEVKDTPVDTFISLEGWKKGVVLVNGFNLGRYWHVGPQKTLYLPGPLLKTGSNEIILFEEEQWGSHVSLVDSPDLGPART